MITVWDARATYRRAGAGCPVRGSRTSRCHAVASPANPAPTTAYLVDVLWHRNRLDDDCIIRRGWLLTPYVDVNATGADKGHSARRQEGNRAASIACQRQYVILNLTSMSSMTAYTQTGRSRKHGHRTHGYWSCFARPFKTSARRSNEASLHLTL